MSHDDFEHDASERELPTQAGRWWRWLGGALIWSALAIALQFALGAA